MTSSREVVVVTGAGGMGQAIARRIGSGCAVVLADFDDANLARAADTLRDDGFDVHPVRTDVVVGRRRRRARAGRVRARPAALRRAHGRPVAGAGDRRADHRGRLRRHRAHARRVRAARTARNRRGVHREHGGVVRDAARSRRCSCSRRHRPRSCTRSRRSIRTRSTPGWPMSSRSARSRCASKRPRSVGPARRTRRVAQPRHHRDAAGQRRARGPERRRHARHDRHVRPRAARHAGRHRRHRRVPREPGRVADHRHRHPRRRRHRRRRAPIGSAASALTSPRVATISSRGPFDREGRSVVRSKTAARGSRSEPGLEPLPVFEDGVAVDPELALPVAADADARLLARECVDAVRAVLGERGEVRARSPWNNGGPIPELQPRAATFYSTFNRMIALAPARLVRPGRMVAARRSGWSPARLAPALARRAPTAARRHVACVRPVAQPAPRAVDPGRVVAVAVHRKLDANEPGTAAVRAHGAAVLQTRAPQSRSAHAATRHRAR